ncbi:MAG: hypothetical protein ACFNUU_09825, partial [Campylobacter sp.]|uniref:hypothetical protein n=1 Tax=Campylobacter sp. TaxID=205 RepID=UPI003605D550
MSQARNNKQILKAAVLKFKAKHPSKSKNQSVKFKPSRPGRKQSCGLKVKFTKKPHKLKRVGAQASQAAEPKTKS